jgi:uncharacterized membrane protein YdjX (TVP38/TMEM64 family)
VAEVTQQKPRQHIRLALLISILVALFLVGRYTGVAENVDAESIRELIRSAGVWGWALYIATFAGGEFIHIPGMVFVLAGILIYGQVVGFGLAWMASVVSVCFSFVVVRRLGGTPLANVEKPWVKRILGRLNAQPIRTVVVLRLVLWLAPPLNYALALTNVRFRDYLIGSALGLIAPVAGVAILFDWLFNPSGVAS